MKKALFLSVFLFALIFVTACGDPRVPTECEQVGSHQLEYNSDREFHWQECTREGCEYRTEAVAHSGGTATCQSMKKCQTCNAIYGTVGEHTLEYIAGTDTHSGRCTTIGCDYVERENPHSGGKSTCEESAACEFCGAPYGDPTGHRYAFFENECGSYQECAVCQNRMYDEQGDHLWNFDTGVCTKCHLSGFDETIQFQLSSDGLSYFVANGEDCKLSCVVIPATYKGLPVTEIAEWSFSFNEYIKIVFLPDTVKSIGTGAFNTSSIKSIVCSDSLEVIGASAFCASDLETIVLGTGIKEIQQDAFSSTKIKSITFPGSVEIVADATFSDCELLEEVIIQDGVKHIERLAFAYCPNLTSLILPNTLESMPYEALEDTLSLEYEAHQGLKYLGSTTNPYFALAGYAGAINAVIHPDTEFCMGHALLNCEEIVSLEIGSKVRTIEEWALSGMDALEAITVASGNLNYYAINNLLVDTRVNMPVLGCKTSVIPDDGTISEVNLNIFDLNNSIKTIYIPKGIKTVHVDFAELRNLEMIVFESDVEHVIVSPNFNQCIGEEKDCYSVFYRHTEEEWKQVTIEYTFNRNAFIRPADCYGDSATHYFYSETQPEGEGNYWHYVDGVPTPW